MMISSTPVTNQCFNQPAENSNTEFFNESDTAFYENIKPQLDQLKKDPQEETISKILAYSKSL
ncbi:hypothetical protein [Pedobacter antarcticus]|uniref:hypothetical protein n=1 Tax=Pedobacter antarcticus TaxID=34086 RepID=UPI00292CFDDC|nr:hypothetical protein [Pedobacter antarcticus]